MRTIDEWCRELHNLAVSKGFWDVESPVSTKLMLVVTELGEACEADRKGDWDNFREEIADTVIRIFDLCGALDIDIEREIEKKHAVNKNRPLRHGKRY